MLSDLVEKLISNKEIDFSINYSSRDSIKVGNAVNRIVNVDFISY